MVMQPTKEVLVGCEADAEAPPWIGSPGIGGSTRTAELHWKMEFRTIFVQMLLALLAYSSLKCFVTPFCFVFDILLYVTDSLNICFLLWASLLALYGTIRVIPASHRHEVAMVLICGNEANTLAALYSVSMMFTFSFLLYRTETKPPVYEVLYLMRFCAYVYEFLLIILTNVTSKMTRHWYVRR